MSTSELFRSEVMSRCQLYIQNESAYNSVAELGELGVVQFIDLNMDVSCFQRKFVNEVKRCEEMERKLRYIEREVLKDEITIIEPDVEYLAPFQREMTELENDLNNIERDLSEVNANYMALRQNQQELLEMQNIIRKTEHFMHHSIVTSKNEELQDEHIDDTIVNLLPQDEHCTNFRFNIIAGILDRSKMISFERLLFRVSKGNVYVRFADIDERLIDPLSGNPIEKVVFVTFFRGEQLRNRLLKICEGYHAHIYPCPQRSLERREMAYSVNTRLEDINTILHQTEQHRRRFLIGGANNLRQWYTKVRKIKAIYHCLSMFSFDVTQKALVAECWLPEKDLESIQVALRRAAQRSGTNVPPILSIISCSEVPPTFNRVNKYTTGFQHLVDAYGVNTYREINPAVYTIATFPFLFAVMFGDVGHGFLMFLTAIVFICYEERLAKRAVDSEIFAIFFGGRYIILLMGFFSIFTGLIYNDLFSKSINIFGSHWSHKGNMSFPMQISSVLSLDPGDKHQYLGHPYPLGIDPVWQLASNKIMFLNTYKLKISLIFGLLHMVFGVCLSSWNKMLRLNYSGMLLEFVPQLVFLVFIFCYLVLLIFYKWVAYYADVNNSTTNQFSEHCAPNLLITFINMMLFKSADVDANLNAICQGHEIYMFSGQAFLQKFLVIIGVLMIPIMLFGMPIRIIWDRRQQNTGNYVAIVGTSSEDEADNEVSEAHEYREGNGHEMPFGEIMIFQGIHTIEYVLSSVSHTASYLRLWALSLAHSQLSEVLWHMVMRIPLIQGGKSFTGSLGIFIIFSFWALLTVSILVIMEGLSAFLHTLRLHWVEFQSKFYEGQGTLFSPYCFKSILKDSAQLDKEFMKGVKSSS